MFLQFYLFIYSFKHRVRGTTTVPRARCRAFSSEQYGPILDKYHMANYTINYIVCKSRGLKTKKYAVLSGEGKDKSYQYRQRSDHVNDSGLF